jgi:hypothetical protein
MNNDIRFERLRRIRKSIGKRPELYHKHSQNFEQVKEKLLEDIKLEIE